MAHVIFEELCKIYEKQGLHAQMTLIQKALNVRSQPDVPLLKMAEQIDVLHTRIAKMGMINMNDLHAIFLLNCLPDCHDSI